MANRILVTGSEGFIGRHIVNELLRQGCGVLATDIYEIDRGFCPYEYEKTDVTKPDTLVNLVKKADAIIHTAGLVRLDANADALDKVNHLGTRNLLETIKQNNPNIDMIVHLSSIGVYGKNCRAPIYEEDAKMPRNAYELSKYNAEKAVEEYKNILPIAMLRPSFVYGIGCQHKDALPIFRMLQGKKIPMIKKGPRASHVHAEDVARAAVFLLKRKDLAGDAFNICDDAPIYLEDFAKAMAEPFGVEINPVIPYSPTAMKALRWMLNRVPKEAIRKTNSRLRKKWDKYREEHNVKAGLFPCIDTAWLDYLAYEKVFSIEKLESVGFALKHASAKNGLRKMAEHYIENNYA
ncbi:MAG: NAD(P)-dependent oxidoreductase [Candidatus Nanoarchaeia archaeon]|nr:NAD(P)-dependent oxidoreductase [Candidatus Nanoarchaeia archaeon]